MGSKSKNTSHGFTKSATVGSEPASTEQQRGKRGDDMEEFDITAPLQSETLKDYIFSLLPPQDLKAAVLVQDPRMKEVNLMRIEAC